MSRTARQLTAMYRAMVDALGPSHWWPGETPFEVAVGAILTQNTNWKNVEKAIEALKAENALTPRAMHALPQDRLEACIRSSGYFRQKAIKLRNFLKFLRDEADWDIGNLAGGDQFAIREKLLALKGVGPETADSILLYALDYPAFVVDAYTARIMGRHGLIPEDGVSYAELQELFTGALEPDAALFNEYHALLVRVGKDWCAKSAPKCQGCPLEDFLE